MRQFREALEDINIRVSEQTLLEVGRYFQAPTIKDHRSQHNKHDTRFGKAHGDRGNAIDCTLVEMSYISLLDIVFGRTSVRKPSSTRAQSKINKDIDGPSGDWEEKAGDGSQRQETALINHTADVYNGNDESDDEDDRFYVNVGRIRAARVSVIDAADGLGRSPLFLAAAAGIVPAAKTLIRHGAEFALAVDGTGLTPYRVAPSLTMRRVLTAEARQSLYRAVSERTGRHYLCDATLMETTDGKDENRDQDDALEPRGGTVVVAEAHCDMTRRMETWVSTLAEWELPSGHSSETRVDQKTSLFLAATAGLPGAVKSLLSPGPGESKKGARHRPIVQGAIEECSAQPTWTTSWKPCDSTVGNTRLKRAYRSFDHHSSSQHAPSLATLTTDANGWSALHACCAQATPQHFSCVRALLESQTDPNARTNTGKTPLHVAANTCASADHRSGVSCLHEARMGNLHLRIKTILKNKCSQGTKS